MTSIVKSASGAIQLKKREDSISMDFEERLVEGLANNSSYIREWIESERESNYKYMMEHLSNIKKNKKQNY